MPPTAALSTRIYPFWVTSLEVVISVRSSSQAHPQHAPASCLHPRRRVRALSHRRGDERVVPRIGRKARWPVGLNRLSKVRPQGAVWPSPPKPPQSRGGGRYALMLPWASPEAEGSIPVESIACEPLLISRTADAGLECLVPALGGTDALVGSGRGRQAFIRSAGRHSLPRADPGRSGIIR